MKKITILLALFIIGFLAMSSVDATDNVTDNLDDLDYVNDVVNVDDILTISTVNDTDNEMNPQESTYDYNNEILKKSVGNDEILNSPLYNSYTVKIKNVTKFYDESEYIAMTISPASAGGYRYDFYLKIYDSNNVQKVNERYYDTAGNTYEQYPLKSKSLDPGIYMVKIVNYADNHEMASATLTIKSIPYSAYSVSISDTNCLYKTSTRINMKVSPASSYYYKYDFYLKIYDSKNIEKFSERFYSTKSSTMVVIQSKTSTWEPGTYTMKIINNVDNHVMKTAKLNIVTIPYSAYSLSVSNINMDYGTNETITMYISPAESEYLKYDFYLKIFDSDNTEKISKRYASTNSSTRVIYNMGGTDLNPGNYNIRLINTVDNHLMATSNLTVKSVPYSAYSVSVSNINLYYNIGGTISISITPAKSSYFKYDFYLKILDSNNVEKVSKRYYNTVSSTKVTYNVGSNSLKPGVYTIKIINNDDGYLMKTAKLTIDAVKIETSNLTCDCDKIIQYKVHITKNNENVAGLRVTFLCNDNEYTNVTDSDGYAYLNMYLNAGNYSITTKCNGAINNNILFIKSVYLDNKYRNMYIDSVTTYYGINESINYGWEGQFIGSLNIYKNSVLIKTINLDTSTYVKSHFTYFKYSNFISTLLLKDVGEYSLKIVDRNGNILNESYVEILKMPTMIQTNNVKMVSKAGNSLFFIVKEKFGEKYPNNGNLKIKINGKTYKVKVNNGVGKLLFIAPSKVKTYSCSVSFLENSNYKASSAKFNIVVKKYNSRTTVNSVTITQGSKYTLKINVKYSNGNKIKSGTVKVQINGKTYTGKISKGVAKVKITAPSKVGKYDCKATYSGNKLIHGSSDSFTITSQQKHVDIIVNTKFNIPTQKSSGKFTVVTYKKMFYFDDAAGVYVAVYDGNQEILPFNGTVQVWVHRSNYGWENLYIHDYMSDANGMYKVNEISDIDKIKVRIWT